MSNWHRFREPGGCRGSDSNGLKTIFVPKLCKINTCKYMQIILEIQFFLTIEQFLGENNFPRTTRSFFLAEADDLLPQNEDELLEAVSNSIGWTTRI